MSIYDHVERNMDRLVEGNVDWSQSAAKAQLEAARAGQLRIPCFDQCFPPQWLGEVREKDVLCLAGAGGLQGPLLACAGARVTVLDLSSAMLARDAQVAAAEGLSIRLEHGNMCEMSRFADASFDIILNPLSLMYVPDVRPVYRECARVLRPGGRFLFVAPCPINYLCDFVDDGQGGYYRAVHRMPYRSTDFPEQGDWVEFGHTMADYLGGLLENGFVLKGYEEIQREDITELYFMAFAEKQTKGDCE